MLWLDRPVVEEELLMISKTTVGTKSIFSIFSIFSKQLQITISWVLDELEKRHFRHFTQHGQGFFEVKYQLFTTSGSSAAGPQRCKVATFLQSVFLAKKFRQAANTIHKQLLIEN